MFISGRRQGLRSKAVSKAVSGMQQYINGRSLALGGLFLKVARERRDNQLGLYISAIISK